MHAIYVLTRQGEAADGGESREGGEARVTLCWRPPVACTAGLSSLMLAAHSSSSTHSDWTGTLQQQLDRCLYCLTITGRNLLVVRKDGGCARNKSLRLCRSVASRGGARMDLLISSVGGMII